MSKIEVDEIVPRSGNNLTVGSSGQTIIVPAGATFNASNSTFTLPDGTVTAAKIASSLDLSGKTVTLPASAVTAHVTPFDDNKIVNDISTLALRQASDQNKSAYNTNSQSVDVFQDDTGIDTTTNVSRNASEYVSSVSLIAESGGTEQSPNSLSITDHPGFGFIFESATPGIVETQSGYGGSYNFGGYSSQQITNKFWIRWHISSLSASSDPSANPKMQFGIINNNDILNSTGASLATGSNVNLPECFWFGYNGNNGGNIYPYKGGTLQTTIAKTLGTGQSLQLVGDGTDLKLYHSSSSNTWYDSGADLIHTFSNYTDSGNDKRFVIGIGLDDFSQNQQLATNFSWKDNITTLQSSTANATGNFTGTTITAPSSVSSMGAIITYQDNAGTNALNTDIVLQLSADGGSNYSTATLTALPDFSTGIKMAKVNDLAVTAGTQLKYKISFANQASGTKEARIRGVALQY